MKIRVTMKDPDCLHDAIREAVKEDVKALSNGLFENEVAALEESRIEKAGETCARWFAWGECLTVEIDTEAGTAIVLPKRGA